VNELEGGQHLTVWRFFTPPAPDKSAANSLRFFFFKGGRVTVRDQLVI
jgi:hypothetical protein